MSHETHSETHSSDAPPMRLCRAEGHHGWRERADGFIGPAAGLTPRWRGVDSLHFPHCGALRRSRPKRGAMAAHRWLRITLVVSFAAAGLTCSDGAGPRPVMENRVAVRGTTPSFNNTPLLRPDGSSEPAIAIGLDGTMGLSGLSWTQFFTNVWKGPFGSTPVFQGQIDAHIGKSIGGGDADIDLGSTGTLHATTLVFFFNPTFNALQLGVSAITCPNANTSNDFASCKAQILDQTQSDRQWVTSDGARVYISYHDAGSSTLIHVQRSDDDGFTFKRVGDPVVAQGRATGTATFNNIFVSRSTDLGRSWTANKVFSAPLFTALNNVFPSLAADPADGTLYAVWSDAHTVSLSRSGDQGATWSPALVVSSAPAATAVFPWVAALNGTVDVVFYGTNASSK